MVNEHQDNSEKEIDRYQVSEIFQKEGGIVDEFGFQLLKSEVGHINESLKKKSSPTPNLLIKYYKQSNTNG